MAMSIAGQLMEFGEIKRGVLGVSIQTLTPDLAKAFGAERDEGVVISMVAPDSPAERAGLEVGDIVLSINDKTAKTVNDMRNFIGVLRAGSEIQLEVLRGDREMEITAVIEEREKKTIQGTQLDERLDGVVLKIVSTRKNPNKHAALVDDIQPGSPAHHQGLRKGDLILAVNRRRIHNFDDFARAVNPTQPILLRLQRGRSSLFLALK